MPRLIHSPNPLYFKKDQRRFSSELSPGSTVADFLRLFDVDFERDVLVTKNGITITDYDVLLAEYDVISVKAIAKGGDNTLAILATIALAVAAPYAAAAIPGIAGSALATSVATGVFTIAGTVLINALFAPSQSDNEYNVEPTFSISGSRNRARPEQPICILVGKHRMAPDLSAKPYSVFQGEDQYLRQAFTFGLSSDITISDLKIGDTAIDDYDDIQYELSSGNTGALSIFPQNVDTIAGAELTSQGETVIRTSSVDTSWLQLDITTVVYHTNSKGQISGGGLNFRIDYRLVGSGTWLPFGSGVYQINGGTVSPQRRAYTLDVALGQYEVRVTRNSNEGDIERDGRQMVWDSLKSYQPDDSDYTDQKRLGLSIRASGQLRGTVDELNALVSAKCLVWDGFTWNLEETGNPAWWFLYFARGRYASDGRLEFGAGLPDSEIDIEGIKQWGAWCDSFPLEINYIFNQKQVVDDVLSTIARVGRGGVSFHTGTLGVVYDEGYKPITQVFQMSNIVADSFNVSYVSEKLADQVILDFLNEDEDYTQDEVRVNVPGVVSPINPVRVKVPGLTNLDQAGAEANLIAAEQFYRRRFVSFETDLEGLVASKGDVVSVSHDLTSWGQSGRLLTGAPHTTLTVYLSHDVSFDDGAGGSYYLRVRHPDGTSEVVGVQYSATPTNTLTLLQSLSQNPSAYPDSDSQDAIWQFNPTAEPGRRMKIISIDVFQPDAGRCGITLVDDDDKYYDSVSGLFDHDLINYFNANPASVSNLTYSEELQTMQGPILVTLQWDLENATGARVRIRFENPDDPNLPDNSWRDFGDVDGRQFQFSTQNPQTITVELVAVPDANTRAVGGALIETFAIQGVYKDGVALPIMDNVVGLELFNKANDGSFTGKDAKFRWRPIGTQLDPLGNDTTLGIDDGGIDINFQDYQIVMLSGTQVLRTDYTTLEEYTYAYEKNYEDTGSSPIREFTIEVRARGQQNQLSLFPARLTVANPAPKAITAIQVDAASEYAFIDLRTPEDPDYEGIGVWSSTTSGFTPTGTILGQGNMVYKGRNDNITIGGLTPEVQQYFIVAAFDTFGLDALNYSGEFYVTPGLIQETQIADDSISTPKLRANAVTTDKLNAGAVSADKIQANAIQTYHLTANSITAESGVIANAAVDTLTIAGNAVTINASSYLSTDLQLFSGVIGTSWSTWREILSVYIDMGTVGAVANSALVLSSGCDFILYPRGSYIDQIVEGEVRITDQVGNAISTSVFPYWGTNLEFLNQQPIQATAAGIMTAPSNTQTGVIRFDIKARFRKRVFTGTLDVGIYAPKWMALYAGGTKR